MRDLLFLAHRLPFPPDKGDKIRAFHVLRHLAKDYRVHLGCFVDDPNDAQYAGCFQELCATTFIAPLSRKRALIRGLGALGMGRSLSEYYFRDARMTRWVSETVARVAPENIFVFCSSMAPYAMPYASTHRVLLDMVDVDSEKWRAYGEKAAWPMKGLYARESRALFALERRAVLNFARSFFVSSAEAELFLRAAPETRARVGFFQNGVDLNYFNPARVYANPFGAGILPIVFTGTMDYRPNVEGVAWFSEEVLPAIRRNHPKAEFWIVGSNPVPRVTKLAHKPGVRVTGRVPDVRPFLAHAACVVAPLQIARGLQNKVIEAMAMAKPVIATPQGCEGLSAVAGKDLLVAETPATFAAVVSSVLGDGTKTLGNQARLRIESDYDWDRNLTILDELLDRATGDPAQAVLRLGPQAAAILRAAS